MRLLLILTVSLLSTTSMAGEYVRHSESINFDSIREDGQQTLDGNKVQTIEARLADELHQECASKGYSETDIIEAKVVIEKTPDLHNIRELFRGTKNFKSGSEVNAVKRAYCK